MSEIFKDSEINVQSLALHRVLEGLIHNINTPLNLILGYSQQLKKQYPDITNLDKIHKAGLTIDDLMQSCARNIIQRLGRTKSSFDINLWLQDEIKLLNDVLEIKHKISIVTQLQASEVIVESSPLLLSLFVESLVLMIRNSIEHASTGMLTISLDYADEFIEIAILLPETCRKTDLKHYLEQLQVELEHYSGISFTAEYPFMWSYFDNNIKLQIPLKGIE